MAVTLFDPGLIMTFAVTGWLRVRLGLAMLKYNWLDGAALLRVSVDWLRTIKRASGNVSMTANKAKSTGKLWERFKLFILNPD